MSTPCVVHLGVNPGEGLTIVRRGRMSFYGESADRQAVAREHLAIAVGASVLDAAVVTLGENGVTPWVHVRVDLCDIDGVEGGGSLRVRISLPAVTEHVEGLVGAAVRQAPILGLLARPTGLSIVTNVAGPTGLVA